MPTPWRRRLRRWRLALQEVFRKYFVAGILFFAPIAITLWTIFWIIGALDRLLLPRVLAWVGFENPPHIPLVGALFTLAVILLLGVVARHLLPFEITRRWTKLIDDIPVAGAIYGAVRQLFEAIFEAGGTSRFNRVVLIEYPRKGIYALAFITGEISGVVQDATPGRVLSCFIPTTPNPTSGFYLLVPESEIIEVDLTVEDAFKLIMSAGLVGPGAPGETAAPARAETRAG